MSFGLGLVLCEAALCEPLNTFGIGRQYGRASTFRKTATSHAGCPSDGTVTCVPLGCCNEPGCWMALSAATGRRCPSGACGLWRGP